MLKKRSTSKSKSLPADKQRKKDKKPGDKPFQSVCKNQKLGDFDYVFEAITDPIVVFDADFNVIKINKAAKHFFAGNPIGKKCFFIKHKFALACKNCPTWQTLKVGAVTNSEILSPVTGKPLLLKTYPIYNRLKRIKGVILIGRESNDIPAMQMRHEDL